mmetsp:Transcript_21083/g.56173  ORF Transcript_21083/g.56173 Transcript_21083/m.56173 type:complete len:274 (-) Transcript_21083:302-1123(-)
MFALRQLRTLPSQSEGLDDATSYDMFTILIEHGHPTIQGCVLPREPHASRIAAHMQLAAMHNRKRSVGAHWQHFRLRCLHSVQRPLMTERSHGRGDHTGSVVQTKLKEIGASHSLIPGLHCVAFAHTPKLVVLDQILNLPLDWVRLGRNVQEGIFQHHLHPLKCQLGRAHWRATIEERIQRVTVGQVPECSIQPRRSRVATHITHLLQESQRVQGLQHAEALTRSANSATRDGQPDILSSLEELGHLVFFRKLRTRNRPNSRTTWHSLHCKIK